jgi:hypothetical protein
VVNVDATSVLEITFAFSVATIAIKLNCLACPFARRAAIFLPVRHLTAARRILAFFGLFFFSHFMCLLFFSIYGVQRELYLRQERVITVKIDSQPYDL